MTQALVDEGNTVADIARLVGVTRPTVYAWLRGQEARKNFDRLVEVSGWDGDESVQKLLSHAW